MLLPQGSRYLNTLYQLDHNRFTQFPAYSSMIGVVSGAASRTLAEGERGSTPRASLPYPIELGIHAICFDFIIST